ncbi:MAG: RNA-binding protein [Aquiluna sp.]
MLQGTLQHLVRAIVDNPDEVLVEMRTIGKSDLLEIRVHPDDLGRVIGKGGRTATALRTIVNALADGKRIRVDVVDTDY